MARVGFCRLCSSALAACAALLTSPSFGAPIVLKEYDAPGYTYTSVPDTLLDGYKTAEKQYNYGGVGLYSISATTCAPI